MNSWLQGGADPVPGDSPRELRTVINISPCNTEGPVPKVWQTSSYNALGAFGVKGGERGSSRLEVRSHYVDRVGLKCNLPQFPLCVSHYTQRLGSLD